MIPHYDEARRYEVHRFDDLRRLVVALIGIACVLIASGCQDNEVDNNQVCAFQCDYQQDGTEVGYPAASAGVEARLTEVDVVQVIANAIVEARANGITDFTISVHDHLNNVLAVFDSDATTLDYSRITSVERPNGEDQTLHDAIVGTDFDVDFSARTPTQALDTALDGVFIPAGYGAMSKAGTANYFSTQGNAFSSRTANTLIQQNFVPGETDRPGGPLFAVQIAQLACSDINTKQIPNDPTDLVGPRRLPVGFAADPGGIPLYKDGIAELDANGNPTGRTGKVVVGSVGIEFNGIYALDKDATDQDRNLEERIAVGASRGFEADPERTANRITVAGRALRFADDKGLRSRSTDVPRVTAADIGAPGGTGATEAAFLNGGVNSPQAGAFVYDPFFFPFAGVDSGARDGVFFLDPTSGVIAATLTSTASGVTVEGEIVTDAAGINRFPAIDTTVFDPSDPPVPADPANPAPGDGLSAEDVQELLVGALRLAERTRAQTRTPLGGQARIDVAVTDLNGVLLGFARSQDALLDGVDVTIAKTRTSGFWSKATAQAQLRAADDPLGTAGLLNAQDFDVYLADTAAFLGEPPPSAPPDTTVPPFNGDVAWSSIALGAISNPDFPPGVLDAGEGPLSREDGEWSIFSTGIQTEVPLPGIALALCEAVPDLANVLAQLGVVADPGTLYDIDGAGALNNVAFCQSVRTALGLPADPLLQPDCLQGVQDQAPGGFQDQIRGLQNGFHIFQGAVPIYRGNTLIGSYGVSGDGAEQDDFVPFVGLDEVFKAQRARGIANPIRNAPKNIRADNISVQNINLRYVVCPVAPLLDSNDQTVCSGL